MTFAHRITTPTLEGQDGSFLSFHPKPESSVPCPVVSPPATHEQHRAAGLLLGPPWKHSVPRCYTLLVVDKTVAGKFINPWPYWLWVRQISHSLTERKASPSLFLSETQRRNLNLCGEWTSWWSECDKIPACCFVGCIAGTASLCSDPSALCVGQPRGMWPSETWGKITLTESQHGFPARGDKAHGSEWQLSDPCCTKSSLKYLIIRYMNAYPSSYFFLLTHI